MREREHKPAEKTGEIFEHDIVLDYWKKTIRISNHKEITIVSKVTQKLSISVSPAVQPLTIVTTTLPPATVGQPYFGQIDVTGGVPPDTLGLDSGVLPDGLTLNSDGSITGTPLPTAVSEDFTISVTDSAK